MDIIKRFTRHKFNPQLQSPLLQKTGLQSMAWLTQNKSGIAVQSLVEQIITTGQMSRKDHVQLTSAILSDQRITDVDRQQINRVFDYIQIGRLKLID
jgi:hypothetical protein